MNDNTVYFSNFRTCGKLENAVSIARTTPKWFKGDKILDLAPTMSMIQRFKKNNAGQWKWFLNEYTKKIYETCQLEEFCEQLKGKVVLCHCSKTDICHRILLAKVLEIEFGAECKEVGGWDIPFSLTYEKMEKFVGFYVMMEGEKTELVGNYIKYKDFIAKNGIIEV